MDGKQGEIRTVTDPVGLETTTWRTASGQDSTRTPDGTLTLVARSSRRSETWRRKPSWTRP
jgi:hypothetical protein